MSSNTSVTSSPLSKIDIVRDVLAVVTKFFAKILGGISKIIDIIFNIIDKSFNVLIDKCINTAFPISWLFLGILLFITSFFMYISQTSIEYTFSQSSKIHDTTFSISILAWLFLLWLFVFLAGKRENKF
jgi:ABC-type Na+ efflux pump permease subunit